MRTATALIALPMLAALGGCDLLQAGGARGLPDGSSGIGPCVFTDADGGRPVPEDGGVSFAKDVQQVFAAHCTACHAIYPEQSGSLNLAPASAYGQLVNAPCSAGCDPNAIRVAPGAPDASMLWLKITADPRRCNAPMPYGSPGLAALCPGDARVLELWISEGAPRN